jgi:hypothetical protein
MTKHWIAQTKDTGDYLMLKTVIYNQINSEIRTNGLNELKIKELKDPIFEQTFYDYAYIESMRIFRSIKLSLLNSFKDKDTPTKHILSFKKALSNMKKLKEKLTIRTDSNLLEQLVLSKEVRKYYFKLKDIIDESMVNIEIVIDLIQDILNKLSECSDSS